MPLRWLIPLVIFALSAGGYSLWQVYSGALPGWAGGEARIPVTVAPVRRTSVPLTVALTGELAAVRETDVVSHLAGKVTAVHVGIGDSVRAGTIVATVHAGALAKRAVEAKAGVDTARQDLASKEELLIDAERRLAKFRELHQQDLIARREVGQAQTALDMARAHAELARAKLAQQEAMLAQTHTLQGLTGLSAPIDGVVTRRRAEPGSLIAESTPILTIADPRTLRLAGKLSGVHSGDIHKGMAAELSSLKVPGAVSKGNIVRVALLETTETQAVQVEIHIDNTKGIFRPGMAAAALISLDQRKEVLLVPRSTVVRAEGRSYVFKLAGDRSERREVSLGDERGEAIEVKDGLKEGDSVIVGQLNLLKTGSSVRVVAASPSPATDR